MPFTDDPHYCKPPIWPWLYRTNQVWDCPKCHTKWFVSNGYSKKWKKVSERTSRD